jgi:hydroxymethylpyrimidine/phosphomethylpyrimidine kinase
MKKVLTIAGSDSGGGAGIQADLKAITVLGGYGMSVLTALTAQNTVGVQGVHPVPPDFVRLQMDSVLSDIGADAAKTGMLATAEIVRTVAERIREFRVELLVVDPVMMAKSGDPLLEEDAREALIGDLLPLARIVTPNLPEAQVLSGLTIQDLQGMKEAARRIYKLGPRFVLIKGGHLEGRAVDLLYDGRDFQTFDAPRLPQRNTHGTGCTFSAALATLLAQGFPIKEAAARAKSFITLAIAHGLEIGSGHGPTNPYAHIQRWVKRAEHLRQLGEALERLSSLPLGHLIPEVRSNLGFALPGATGPEEVAAVPGRISQIGRRILICREPAFGASRHIARVILAAMNHDPALRSAMNIRYSREVIHLCSSLGLRAASFDRSEEPPDVKQREGSTLEWGTHRALERADGPVDLVYDRGEMGKEPMVRILGRTPQEVVEKVRRIGEALS